MMESGTLGLGELNLITTVIAPGVRHIPNQLFLSAVTSQKMLPAQCSKKCLASGPPEV